MGQSTDGIIFYGYCWEEEAELFEENEEESHEWPEIVAMRRGLTKPWSLYQAPPGLRYDEENAHFKAWQQEVGFDALYKVWSEQIAAIKAEYGGVIVSSHCSCDYPMPYIAIARTELTAWRGSPIEITTDHFVGDTTNWDLTLETFVNELGIDISDAKGPGWFLVSNWC
jgi:hypothetical protein